MATPTLFVANEPPMMSKHHASGPSEPKERPVSSGEKEKPPKQTPQEAEEAWEIPAFLRKKKK
jgi:hypothetical protein